MLPPQVILQSLWVQFHLFFCIRNRREWSGGEEGWGLGCVCYTAVVWKKAPPLPDHYQSCGTTVIKTWMSLRGCRPESIFHRSLGPSLLIDRSPAAAAPFCKAHCIITQQKHFIFSTYVEIHEQPVQVANFTFSRERKKWLSFQINTLFLVLCCHSQYCCVLCAAFV